jgi:hypothetical protein
VTQTETHMVKADDRDSRISQSSVPGSKRRFTVAVVIGLVVVTVPYTWALFDLWNGSLNLLRTAQSNGYSSNFYDLQARAMFHGHLWVANGALGGEAFVHAGRQYTYFGLFPSFLRMPVLALTHSVDGRLTALSMLVAWLLTALFTSLLVWRVRHVVRGAAPMGRMEAASYGVLVATIMGGSVLVYLASNPFVFSEDLTWSVALAIGSLFALLGVLERPSWGRVLACGVLILATNLTRATTGYACVIGAVLAAVWFARGRGEDNNRRWSLPILMAGLVPLAVACLISFAKFGIFFGLPTSEQVVFQTFGVGHVNNGKYFGFHFLPSTLVAYFQPSGLRLTSVFPFLTLPSGSARSVGGIVLYGGDRTASVPSSMPMLFLASLWGAVSAFRPRPAGRSTLLRIVLLAALTAGGTVMIFGWIFDRFIADFLPFLILASAVGMVDVWRRLQGRNRRVCSLVLVLVAAIAAFEIAANVGIATAPQGEWSSNQTLRYVQFQKSISDVTGHPLAGNVVHGNSLPIYAPADRLFVIGSCAGLYISDGWSSKNNQSPVLNAVDLQTAWQPVELGPDAYHRLDITFHRPVTAIGPSVPLITIGTQSVSTVALQPYGADEIRFSFDGPLGTVLSAPLHVQVSRTYRVTILTDSNVHLLSVTSQHGELLRGFLFSHGPVLVHTYQSIPRRSPDSISVVNSTPPPNVSLCRSLP